MALGLFNDACDVNLGSNDPQKIENVTSRLVWSSRKYRSLRFDFPELTLVLKCGPLWSSYGGPINLVYVRHTVGNFDLFLSLKFI